MLPAYEIPHVRAGKDTKLLLIPEAKNTLLHVVIGNGVQTHILIKMVDLLNRLEDMGVIEGKEVDKENESLVPLEAFGWYIGKK